MDCRPAPLTGCSLAPPDASAQVPAVATGAEPLLPPPQPATMSNDNRATIVSSGRKRRIAATFPCTLAWSRPAPSTTRASRANYTEGRDIN
jgi:hypothetical protein